MSNLDISLYDEVVEGLTYNRELEIYYDDLRMGLLLMGNHGNFGKIKSFWLNVMIFTFIRKSINNGRSLKDIIEASDCGLLLM